MLHNRADSLRRICKIDVTAFASVMVVLVVALLMAQAMSNLGFPNPGVSIDLPKVGHPSPMHGANRDGALMVMIMRDGKVFFGNDQVMTEKLSAKITERLANSQRNVYIKADAHVSYGTVKEVLDEVRFAGIGRVVFLAEQRKLPAWVQ